MASNYHIQKPYVLATLPRSLAQPESKSVVGEVYGQKAGAKKRRRPEVAVGIDGEAANLYDIASSRLITSYPVPPQASFSCPPCSLRLRPSTAAAAKKADVARYTYISTREPARKLSLFKDTVGASGATASATVSTSLGRSDGTVVFLTTTNSTATTTTTTSTTKSSTDAGPELLVAPDLLAVAEDGEVTFFDGETLKDKHKVSVAALSQDLLPRGSVLRVELAQTALVADVLKGLQLGDDYLSGLLAQKVDAAGGFNPDVLLLITAVSGRQGGGSSGTTRYLHVLVVDPVLQSTAAAASAASRLVQVHHIRLPSPSAEGSSATGHHHPLYRLDIASGSLFALAGESVVSYDLSRSAPRVIGHMSVPGATSFLQLSKSSILASTSTSFSVYNPVFSSLQASTPLDLGGDAKNSSAELSSSPSRCRSCAFVSYFSQLELAVALVDSHLVAVQLEPPRMRSKKRRADGLLIDSIGRGVSWKEEQAEAAAESGCLPRRKYVPGTVSAAYLQQYGADVLVADRLLADDDVTGFDDFLAEKLGIQSVSDWRWQRPLDAADGAEAVNGTQGDADGADDVTNGVVAVVAAATATLSAPATATPPTTARAVTYPEADRRWVVYAISRVLAVDPPRPGGRLRLRCALPESDILNYLVDAGHLSVANARSALRSSLQGVDDADAFLGEALPVTLAHVDPSLDLLLRWLYATKLAATELLSAILLLMRSLELVAEGDGGSAAATEPRLETTTKLLLTNGGEKMEEDTADDDSEEKEQSSNDDDDDNNGELSSPNQELDRLDQQLRVAEYFLEHVENDPRDLALDIAIGKLGSCPAVATVLGLRRIFRTDEIRSLIEVLRKQLVDQGWATRYVDMETEEEGGSSGSGGNSSNRDEAGGDGATPLNYSIRLIADLLGRCIDSVRPGEWLVDDEATATAATAATAATEAATEASTTAIAITSAEAGDNSTTPAVPADPAAGDFFASLKWQVSAALEGVQEALYLRGILGEAVRYATGVQAATAAAAAARAADNSSKVRPVRLDPAALQASAMLPLGLKAPTGLGRYSDVSPTKVVSGGEVVKRSRREIGHLTSKKVGPYTLERIML